MGEEAAEGVLAAEVGSLPGEVENPLAWGKGVLRLAVVDLQGMGLTSTSSIKSLTV